MADADVPRRFGGVARLYGKNALSRFQASHVCVVGIGGVGSWAVEALARSSIGRMTLVDLDMAAESNVNRQIHALDGAFGEAKVSLMAKRIRAIHPDCQVETIEDFATPDNVESLLIRNFDYLIDATDQVQTKAALIAECVALGIPIITAGSAGGRIDPARVEIADLAGTFQDPLLSKLRMRLRRDYRFPPEGKPWGIAAVFSSEPIALPHNDKSTTCVDKPRSGLNCAGYGSSVCVTAVFGFFAASEVLRYLAALGDAPFCALDSIAKNAMV